MSEAGKCYATNSARVYMLRYKSYCYMSPIATSSPPGSYSQIMPSRSVTSSLPPHLPPLLQQTILNQEPPSEVSTTQRGGAIWQLVHVTSILLFRVTTPTLWTCLYCTVAVLWRVVINKGISWLCHGVYVLRNLEIVLRILRILKLRNTGVHLHNLEIVQH